MVFSHPGEKFTRPGDSGSWVLTGSGEAIGLLIGGDDVDGSGLITSLPLVAKDIEKALGSGDGSVQLA